MNADHEQVQSGRGAGAQLCGFSLVEVLLAIFILSIGLIMVASIFPVGAEWTRQNAEETVASVVAENALSIVRSRFTAADFSSVTTTSVQGVPALITRVSLNERAYQHGSSQPFPAVNPSNATYFWTMLARQSVTSNPAGQTKNYDVYILVFKKGAVEQSFTSMNGTMIPGCRANSGENNVPYVVTTAYAAGSGTPVGNCVPRMGGYGIGVTSGTVFRQIIATTGNAAAPLPGLAGGEPIIMAPAADASTGTLIQGVSPLVFVYQTTLSF